MRDLGYVENDLHNVNVTLATLEREFNVVKFGKYLGPEDLLRFRVVIQELHAKALELNAEAELLRR